MKFITKLSVVALGMCAAGVGCNTNKKSMTDASAPAVSDLSTAPAPVPAYTPPTPVDPTVTSTPSMSGPAAMNSSTMTPAPMTTGGTKYTVKKGDTLWKIAAAHYGDGKNYNKILAANPGLTADKLKAGQSITLP